MQSKLNNNIKSYVLVTLLSGIIAACNSGGSPRANTQQTAGATSKIADPNAIPTLLNSLQQLNISLNLNGEESRISYITMTNYYGYRNDTSKLDGYKISFVVDGNTYYSRTVLVNGQYRLDPLVGKIVMDNADQWESDPTVNPFISPNSTLLSGTVNLAYSTTNFSLSCPNGDNLQAIENSLIAQGRDELATKIVNGLTCNSSQPVEINGEILNPELSISVASIPPTRLYIPFQVNYDGYKTFTIWNSTNGVRADHYGDATSNDPNNDHCPYVDTYSFASNDYDGGHITISGNGYWQGFCWNYSNQLTIAGWE